ncbi:MAG: hypothetical protein J5725_12120 [Bacteroidales bacterium]|nr:hypothetical protein [Bacteroidales bacterium]
MRTCDKCGKSINNGNMAEIWIHEYATNDSTNLPMCIDLCSDCELKYQNFIDTQTETWLNEQGK